MKTKIIYFSKNVAPAFNTYLKSGTKVLQTILPKDWQVHVRISFLNELYSSYVLNMEFPEGELNPKYKDLCKLLFHHEYGFDLKPIKKSLKNFGIRVPRNFWKNLFSLKEKMYEQHE